MKKVTLYMGMLVACALFTAVQCAVATNEVNQVKVVALAKESPADFLGNQQSAEALSSILPRMAMVAKPSLRFGTPSSEVPPKRLARAEVLPEKQKLLPVEQPSLPKDVTWLVPVLVEGGKSREEGSIQRWHFPSWSQADMERSSLVRETVLDREGVDIYRFPMTDVKTKGMPVLGLELRSSSPVSGSPPKPARDGIISGALTLMWSFK